MWRRVSVIGLLMMLVATACDGSSDSQTTRSTRATTTTVAPSTTTTTEPAPDPPPLVWNECGGNECTTLTVPLDYARPRAATIPIALVRRRATDPTQRIGSLVINPGGPGEAGTQLLGRDLNVLTPTVKQRFDIVEMDPRGVGNSGGLHCSDPSASGTSSGSGAKVDPVPVTPEGRAALIEANRGYAQACADRAGPLLGRIGTTDTARDLDQLRKALGDERLTFLGVSYGTLLGATYADLFPTRVRALVLDGVIDGSLPSFELWMAQAVGFQQQLDAFFAACASSCAWRPGIPLPDALDRLIQRVRAAPLPAGDGAVVGVSELYSALFSRLYSRSRWNSLAQALGAAERGDGGPILGITRSYLGETPGATINSDASNAINCLDHPVDTDLTQYEALAAQATMRARHFGPYLAWAGAMCATWEAPPTREPHPVRAPGAPPTLVIGTTNDPATPFTWAQNVAASFEQAVLLTREGTGHVAYFSSSCVRGVVDAYLVNLTPPAPGTVCS
jgi:pimeloyl-ACP methyl ester carboxylesterase